MFKVLFFLFLLTNCACKSKTDIDKEQQLVTMQWQYITIEFNDTAIHLNRSIDTLEIITHHPGIKKYQITKTEKNNLFSQANSIIEFREPIRKFCTDYSSKLKVRITYNSQLTKAVYFSSICNWRELDANTKGIDGLFRKIVGVK